MSLWEQGNFENIHINYHPKLYIYNVTYYLCFMKLLRSEISHGYENNLIVLHVFLYVMLKLNLTLLDFRERSEKG